MLSSIARILTLFAAGLGLSRAAGHKAEKKPRTDSERPTPVGSTSSAGRVDDESSSNRNVDVVRAHDDDVPTGDGGASQPPRAGQEDAPEPRPESPSGGDALAQKHRASSLENDFRAVDYADLPTGAPKASAAQDRSPLLRSNWHVRPAGELERPSMPEPGREYEGRFSAFGGSVVAAGAVRDETRTIEPSAPPSVPLGAPHPDYPTADVSDRQRAAPDPHLDKYKAESFDKNFRAVDYSDLGSSTGETHESSAPERALPRSSGKLAQSQEAAGSPSHGAAFRVSGVSGSVAGASPRSDDADTGRHAPSPHGGKTLGADDPTSGLEPPRLAEPRDGKPDDLTAIKGIGPTIEHLLFECGIFHYDQIAGWRSGEVRWIDQMTGFAGRVDREAWREQAASLASKRTSRAGN